MNRPSKFSTGKRFYRADILSEEKIGNDHFKVLANRGVTKSILKDKYESIGITVNKINMLGFCRKKVHRSGKFMRLNKTGKKIFLIKYRDDDKR